jgi:hypothetical protein
VTKGERRRNRLTQGIVTKGERRRNRQTQGTVTKGETDSGRGRGFEVQRCVAIQECAPRASLTPMRFQLRSGIRGISFWRSLLQTKILIDCNYI